MCVYEPRTYLSPFTVLQITEGYSHQGSSSTAGVETFLSPARGCLPSLSLQVGDLELKSLSVLKPGENNSASIPGKAVILLILILDGAPFLPSLVR